uniref:Uncharacterized protein n=1 Tax=Cucumis melo TaxID=3656 RepID=A0A9I9DZB6_CUCME
MMEKSMEGILEFIKSVELKINKKFEELGHKLNEIIEEINSQQRSSSGAQETMLIREQKPSRSSTLIR